MYNKNVNISNGLDIGNKVDDEISQADGLPLTNSNHIKYKSCYYYCNISNGIGNDISFIEEISPNYLNPKHTKSKCYSDNAVENNRIIENRVDNEKLWLNNLEGLN